jgi:hypothetical protein
MSRRKGKVWTKAQEACARKRRYRDQLSAQLALAQRSCGVVRAYPCPVCNGWHLTSRPWGGGKTPVVVRSDGVDGAGR